MSTQTDSALQAEVNRLKLELQTHKVETGSGGEIQIGDYLLERLAQLGVSVSFVASDVGASSSDSMLQSMFGVPGDFNLGFLDLVEDHPTIDWIGNWYADSRTHTSIELTQGCPQ